MSKKSTISRVASRLLWNERSRRTAPTADRVLVGIIVDRVAITGVRKITAILFETIDRRAAPIKIERVENFHSYRWSPRRAAQRGAVSSSGDNASKFSYRRDATRRNKNFRLFADRRSSVSHRTRGSPNHRFAFVCPRLEPAAESHRSRNERPRFAFRAGAWRLATSAPSSRGHDSRSYGIAALSDAFANRRVGSSAFRFERRVGAALFLSSHFFDGDATLESDYMGICTHATRRKKKKKIGKKTASECR